MPVTSPPTGPVEWVAITFPGPTLGTGVAAPPGQVVEAKTVRVLDAVVVHKAADGTVTEGERGRRGPGLLGTVARTAVVAGTATAVAGRVDAAQQAAAQRQQEGAAAQEQLRQMQLQAQIDSQVDTRLTGAVQAAPPQAAPAPARPSVDELHAQLTKLGELRTAGLLTDGEFAEQKARLLA